MRNRSGVAATGGFDPAGAGGGALLRRLRFGGVYAILAFIVLVGAILYPGVLTPVNLANVVTQAVPLGLTALGMTLVLVTGEIDLSVGSVISIVSVISANGMQARDALIAPVLLAAAATGVAVGLVNGLLTTRLGIPSFIVTLAMLLILQGVNLVWTSGGPSSTLAPAFGHFSALTLGPLPVGALVLAAGTAAIWTVLNRTVAGRALYIVGGNPRAAFIAGIPVARMRTLAFMLCGLFAALAGMFETSYVGSGQSWLGSGMELTAIAATVIGGTSLFGGRGSAAGALGGALLLAVIFNLLVISGVPAAFEPVATGLILLLGVALYQSPEHHGLRALVRHLARAGGTRPEGR